MKRQGYLSAVYLVPSLHLHPLSVCSKSHRWYRQRCQTIQHSKTHRIPKLREILCCRGHLSAVCMLPSLFLRRSSVCSKPDRQHYNQTIQYAQSDLKLLQKATHIKMIHWSVVYLLPSLHLHLLSVCRISDSSRNVGPSKQRAQLNRILKRKHPLKSRSQSLAAYLFPSLRLRLLSVYNTSPERLHYASQAIPHAQPDRKLQRKEYLK